jgi:hypothetical protein
MGTPVSGPGQFSQRTDKAVSNANSTLPDAQYGENRDYQEQKAAGPMASSPGGMDIGSLMGSMAPSAVGFGEPSAQPDTPVTDGAALGAGAGMEAIASPDASAEGAQMKSWIVAMEWLANQPGTSDANRNMIRNMKTML